MTIILGIDPGSRITGYGLVRVEGHRVFHLAHGRIELGQGDMNNRLVQLYDELSALIHDYKPDEAAVEKVFMNRNADSALKLGHARGVAVLCVCRGGLKVAEYTATAIKQTVVGRGHADKAQVQHMVKALLSLDRLPPPDAADALAAAVCHAHTREGLARLALAGVRS